MLIHSHTKRNSLDTRAVFIEFSKYVKIMSFTGGHLHRGQIFFQELEAGDGIEGILAFLDNNMLIAIATPERFRD